MTDNNQRQALRGERGGNAPLELHVELIERLIQEKDLRPPI